MYPPVSHSFYNNFSTVHSMVNGKVPPNWEELVAQSEELRDDAGNELTNIWASQEFDPFHDENVVPEPETSEDFSTPKRSNKSPDNELHTNYDEF